MNDRFRFRVWDIELKKYYPASAFCAGDLQGSGDEIIVEQCTGLKDKNGRLIYEGDILQYTDTHGFKIRQEVVWENDNARFTHVVEDDLGLGYRLSPLEKEICALKEVVGNIHEVEE